MINISHPNILQYPTQLIRNWQVRYNCPMPPTPHTPISLVVTMECKHC